MKSENYWTIEFHITQDYIDASRPCGYIYTSDSLRRTYIDKLNYYKLLGERLLRNRIFTQSQSIDPQITYNLQRVWEVFTLERSDRHLNPTKESTNNWTSWHHVLICTECTRTKHHLCTFMPKMLNLNPVKKACDQVNPKWGISCKTACLDYKMSLS